MQLAPTFQRYYLYAFWLSVFTIVYNLLEGVVSVWFGLSDESLTLFGFGLDSFVESVSGLGILAMVLRIWNNPNQPRGPFEKTALQVTGSGFYVLAGILLVTAIYNLLTGHRPETTLWGAVISTISLSVMWALIVAKLRVGKALSSAAIVADARCAQVCMYMSGVLLASSLIYQLTGIGFVDSLGAIGLAYFSLTEGKEAFEKARGVECACHHGP